MKPVTATLAVIALAVATVGLAQTPQPPEPANQPSESSSGKADRQALMRDCMTQAQAANPSASKQDVKDQCIKQVNQQSSSQPTPHN